MLLSLLDIILMPVIVMTALYLVYFVMRGGALNGIRAASFSRLLAGSLLAGVGSGLMLALALAAILPKYYYITEATSDGYYSRYILNRALFDECGLRFIVNTTSETYSLVAKVYGDEVLDENENPVTPLPPGKTCSMYDVDGWFRQFPLKERDDSRGKIIRHVIPQEWVENELKKEVKYSYDID